MTLNCPPNSDSATRVSLNVILALPAVPARGNAAPPGSRETLNLVILLGVSSTALTTKYVVVVSIPVILPALPNVNASPSSSSPS